MVYPRVKKVEFDNGSLKVDISAYSSLGNVTELYVGAFAPGLLGSSPPEANTFETFMTATFINIVSAANVPRYDQSSQSVTLSHRYTTGTLATNDIGTLTIISATDPCAVCVFAKDDSGAIALDVAAVFEAPTVVSSSFVDMTASGRYIQPDSVSGDIVGQSAGVNTIEVTFDYQSGPAFIYAFATESLLDQNPLTILGDGRFTSADLL